MNEETIRGTRRVRPSARDARKTQRAERPLGPAYITRANPPYELLSEEGLQAVEAHADRLLEEIGLEVRGDAEAIRLWRTAGAKIKDEWTVHVPAGLAREIVHTFAPREFVQHARNPTRSVPIGGPHTVFAPAYGSPFVTDLERGRRYGTIEDFVSFVKLAYLAIGQLARRLGVPLRCGGNLCASKVLDSQAASESANSLWPAFLAGANFVLHSAGWLESGLVMSYEKFMTDVDQCGAFHTLARGITLDENGFALDAFREIGPGKHHLGSRHTLLNYQTAFHDFELADNNSYEQWSAAGGLDQRQRAADRVRALLSAYEPPPLDPSRDEALREYIERRKRMMPDEFA